MLLTDVRCCGCNKLLGRFNGQGEIRCRYCKATTVFDTDTGSVKLKPVTGAWKPPKADK